MHCGSVKIIVQTDYMFLQHKKSASFVFICHLSSREKTMSIHDWEWLVAFLRLQSAVKRITWCALWAMFNTWAEVCDLNVSIYRKSFFKHKNPFKLAHRCTHTIIYTPQALNLNSSVYPTLRTGPYRVSSECSWEGQKGNSRPRAQITNFHCRWCSAAAPRGSLCSMH